MNLKYALDTANAIIAKLVMHCQRIEVAGSIRRKKPWPRDIDIVIQPSNQGALAVAIHNLGQIKSSGPRITTLTYMGNQVDLYIATPQTWATLLLIRTGSKEHNIRLSNIAKSKGMKLHADGSSLFHVVQTSWGADEVRIAGDTEESIFEALGVPYLEPEERG